jgi:hypothetical protein
MEADFRSALIPELFDSLDGSFVVVGPWRRDYLNHRAAPSMEMSLDQY